MLLGTVLRANNRQSEEEMVNLILQSCPEALALETLVLGTGKDSWRLFLHHYWRWWEPCLFAAAMGRTRGPGSGAVSTPLSDSQSLTWPRQILIECACNETGFRGNPVWLGPQWQWYVVFLALKKVQQVSNGFHCRSTIGWIIAALQRRQYMAASGTSNDSFFQEAFRMSQ